MPLPIQARFSINVLENDQKEILLLKRYMKAKLGPGLWGFSAGHIREGEEPGECSQRELHEEIGKDIDVSLLHTIGPVRDTFYGGIYEVHLFHYHWQGGTIELNEEHTAYAWVGPESYKYYNVMDGIDEDLAYLGIWPKQYLNRDKLPAHLR